MRGHVPKDMGFKKIKDDQGDYILFPDPDKDYTDLKPWFEAKNTSRGSFQKLRSVGYKYDQNDKGKAEKHNVTWYYSQFHRTTKRLLQDCNSWRQNCARVQAELAELKAQSQAMERKLNDMSLDNRNLQAEVNIWKYNSDSFKEQATNTYAAHKVLLGKYVEAVKASESAASLSEQKSIHAQQAMRELEQNNKTIREQAEKQAQAAQAAEEAATRARDERAKEAEIAEKLTRAARGAHVRRNEDPLRGGQDFPCGREMLSMESFSKCSKFISDFMMDISEKLYDTDGEVGE